MFEVDAYPLVHVQPTGCAEPPEQRLPAAQPDVAHVDSFPAHNDDPADFDAYPGEHVHATGCAAPPAQEYPALQDWHGVVVPPHAPADAVVDDAYPALHVQATGWPLPPARHVFPAPQAMQLQEPAPDAVAAFPGVHEHANGCACPPAQEKPAGHATPEEMVEAAGQ